MAQEFASELITENLTVQTEQTPLCVWGVRV